MVTDSRKMTTVAQTSKLSSLSRCS